jgi:cytokinin dehydrogenase
VADRRTFLKALGAAGAVIAFDPLARQWVVAGEPSTPGADPLPPLDGEVVSDDRSLTAASSDVGHIASRRPRAVLRPGSVDDVAAMIRYCRAHRIPVAARGAGHSVFGQPLVAGGLAIDMRTLSRIHAIDRQSADVDAGATWRELVEYGVPRGITVPVLTGYIALTIGGTLSVGGISTRPRAGAQVDRARALQVVTGTGDIVWCSETENTDLFEAVLAGFGQFGVITRAIVDTEPAPKRVRHWMLTYADLDVMLGDMWTLVDRGEADQVWCQWGQLTNMPAVSPPEPPAALATALRPAVPLLSPLTRGLLTATGSVVTAAAELQPTGPWMYQLNVSSPHTDTGAPDTRHMLRGMSDIRVLRQTFNPRYLDFVLKIDALVDLLTLAGVWDGVAHPWIDNFVARDHVADFTRETISRLEPDDLNLGGLGLMFPLQRASLRRPSLAQPDGDSEWILLFDVLTAAPAPGPRPAFVADKLARNRAIYERAVAHGGRTYPISAVELSLADWRHHYGPARYAHLQALKALHDPDGIMNADMRIFG